MVMPALELRRSVPRATSQKLTMGGLTTGTFLPPVGLRPYTTVMLRNIPNKSRSRLLGASWSRKRCEALRYTREMLIKQLSLEFNGEHEPWLLASAPAQPSSAVAEIRLHVPAH